MVPIGEKVAVSEWGSVETAPETSRIEQAVAEAEVLVVSCVISASSPVERRSFLTGEPRSTARVGGATEIHCCGIQGSLSTECMSAKAIRTWPVLDVGINDASCVARGAKVSSMALWCKAMKDEAEGARASHVVAPAVASEVLDAISVGRSQILRSRYDGGRGTAT